MRTTKSRKATGEDALTAAERKHAEDFLRRAHAESELWRKCTRTHCRRAQSCAGDIDECGARSFPEGWAWVRSMARALRAGRPPAAAVETADRRVAALEDEGAFGRQPPRKIVIDSPGFNERIEWVIDADGRVSTTVGPLRPDLPWSPGPRPPYPTDDIP
jgi:hypothetical protein